MDKTAESLAVTAYNAVAERLGNMPSFDRLPPELQTSWALAIVQTQALHEFPSITDPIPKGEISCSCAWEVRGGVLPGTPELEFTRRWALASGERHSSQGSNIFTWRAIEAANYWHQLSDPNRLNWAELTWIYY